MHNTCLSQWMFITFLNLFTTSTYNHIPNVKGASNVGSYCAIHTDNKMSKPPTPQMKQVVESRMSCVHVQILSERFMLIWAIFSASVILALKGRACTRHWQQFCHILVGPGNLNMCYECYHSNFHIVDYLPTQTEWKKRMWSIYDMVWRRVV